jgi:hypothetical protein
VLNVAFLGGGITISREAPKRNKNPFEIFSDINTEQYRRALPARIEAITLETQEPERVDYDAAKVMLFAQAKEPALLAVASAVVEASGYEQVREERGSAIEAAREQILAKLSIDARDPSLDTKEQKQELLDRVLTAFTRKEIGTLINGEKATTKSLPSVAIDPKLVQETIAKLNNVHISKAAPRHTSRALDGLNKQVQAMALTKGIGFGW